MKNILIIAFSFFAAFAAAQTNNIYRSGGISQTVGAPTFKPGAGGNIVAIDTVTGIWYISRDRYSVNWLSMGDRIESVIGCSAPLYTPNKMNSDIVINQCSPPELYHWDGAAWEIISGGGGGGGSTNLTISGTSSPLTLNSSSGTDVTLTAGTGVSLSGTSGNATITNSAPDQTVSITGAGINVATGTYPAFTVTGTEVDGSVSNEGSLTVGAGTGTTSIINSNTSGSTGVTLTAAGINAISEVGNVITLTATEVDGSVSNELQQIDTFTIVSNVLRASLSSDGVPFKSVSLTPYLDNTDAQNLSLSGQALSISGGTGATLPIVGVSAGTGIGVSTVAGVATVSNTGIITEVDGSVTNELQTITNTSDATSHTVTLSNSGGSTQLVEGSGITLTTTGTGSAGVVTIASTSTGATNLAISGSSSPLTLTSDTGTDVTLTAGTGVSLSGTSGNATITNSAPDQTVSITGAGINVATGTYPNFTVTGTEVDGSTTNEIQQIDTFTIVSNVLRASLSSDGVPFKSVSLAPYLDNVTTDLTISGSSSPLTLNSSDGTDVTLTAGTGISLSGTSGNATITNTGIITEVDGSVSNEGSLTVGAGSGTTSVISSNTSGSTDVTLTAAGINAISEVGNVITITATEVDGSTSNELQTYGHSGTTTYTNTLSNGGGSWSITGAGIAAISNTAGAVTVTATEVDGSTTNELQTITNSSDATSHTITLSSSGGSTQLVEGSGITLTTTGTGADGIVTIASTGGSGTVTATGGSLTSNAVVLGAGTTDTKVSTGITTDGTAALTLGVNATTIGKVKMFGNTSGDATIQPTAAAGTATVQTLPATTGTLVNRVTTGNGVSASNSDGALSFTLGAITPTTVNGNTLTTGSSTYTGTAGQTYTFPSTTATIARTDAANTFTGVQTFSTPIATGSVATMTATVGGGVPTPPNNTTTFLRGDGTFAAPTAGTGDILNGGNTTAAAVTIGTNDANALNLETNNVTRLSITGGASTGGAVTQTDVSANTNTVETAKTYKVNSSGTAAAGFGLRNLFQLESSTTDAQDAGYMDYVWTTATHASRTADIVFGTANAGAAAESFRIVGGATPVVKIGAGTNTFGDAAITINSAPFTIGATAFRTGTIIDGTSALKITATQPTVPTATQSAIDFQITSAGSATFNNRALNVDYLAGYTGVSSTYAANYTNSVAGTGTGWITSARNVGFQGSCNGTTTGTNAGAFCIASNADKNAGVIGRAISAKNGATNIGVFGDGLNTGTTPIQIGGFFTMNSAEPATLTSAALIADNGTQTDPIFLARDNGSVVFNMIDGGNVFMGGSTSPTAKLHLGAGTTAASTAPLKFTSGSLMTAPEALAVEALTDAAYITTTTGTKRRMIVAGTTGRATAQTAANTSVATYTLGATDASYQVSANVLVTTSSAENFTVTVTYTDEGNTSRTATLNFQIVAGTIGTAIAFANGAVPYMGLPIHIRCKASTAITVKTTGTFTGATYNVEGLIIQEG